MTNDIDIAVIKETHLINNEPPPKNKWYSHISKNRHGNNKQIKGGITAYYKNILEATVLQPENLETQNILAKNQII